MMYACTAQVVTEQQLRTASRMMAVTPAAAVIAVARNLAMLQLPQLRTTASQPAQ
jgi:hypothetical protein